MTGTSTLPANAKPRIVLTLVRRELHTWFTSFMAYLVAALFLLINGFLFFQTFFLYERAELRQFFSQLPVLFSFFIPALTMRLFAEESRSGSLETLMTLPVSSWQVVWGKYLASAVAGASLLLPTVLYAFAVTLFGNPDIGPMVGGFIGSLFLVASYTAVGLFASSCTQNQIVAFFVSFIICMVLSVVDGFAVVLPSALANFITFLSAQNHFNSIARGIIDTRDILYFLSVTALFVALTQERLENNRRAA